MGTKQTKTIVIDLEKSLFAHGFSEHNLIHREEMDKAMEIISKQIKQISDKEEVYDVYLEHNYRTIGVFGDRGSGKTSFLISLLQLCKKRYKDVEILQMIDPTLVEHKKPIILCVISMINKLVEEKLRTAECSVNSDAFIERRKWEKVKKSVASGVISIENVGQDFNNSLWQDEDYVVHTGLKKVGDANDFEANLRRLIKTALDILEKKAFVLSFDDIDVDVEQGWNVLETLRRYLSDSHVISIVSGNIKLYEALARQELCVKLPMKEGEQKEQMTNELGSQYMLKLLKPANRINLLSLKNILQLGKFDIEIEDTDQKRTLRATYEKILKSLGIEDKSTQQVFIDFLLSMSIRSQINFMREARERDENVPPIEVFKSRLLASGIDVDTILNNPQMTHIVILEYFIRTKGLSHRYLLLPVTSDKDTNSNLTALTFAENSLFKNNSFLMFDYMLKIGYIRNVTMSLSDETLSNILNYAGWLQDVSLKNNIGLTMAYLDSKKYGIEEPISLYAMQEVSKKNVDNALDSLLKNESNHIVKVVAMLPYIGVVYRSKNESRSFYSVMSLLAVVAELLKCNSEEEMESRIDDLKFFRSYQMPLNGKNIAILGDVMSASYGVEVDSDSIKKLADMMWSWKSQYNKGFFVPPYVLGRIMTRLDSALSNVEGDTVGDKMCIMVANFFNACIIEESRVVLSVEKNKEIANGKTNKINNNNLRKDTKILKDNLGKGEVINQLKFSKWIMACPILYPFLDEATNNLVQKCIMGHDIKNNVPSGIFSEDNKSEVYELLKEILCKDVDVKIVDDRPAFSGSKDGWKETKRIMIEGGISEDDIIRNIVDEGEINNSVEYIKSINLFSRVYRSSVRQFIVQYRSSENDA